MHLTPSPVKACTAMLAGLCLASACARPVTLAWDAPLVAEMVVGWRIWSGTTLLGSSSVPQATVQIPNAETTVTVTAINSQGESPHSSPLVIPPPMLWIQKSTDLQTWENVVQIPYQPTQFIRLQLPPP